MYITVEYLYIYMKYIYIDIDIYIYSNYLHQNTIVYIMDFDGWRV
jgi:hypothetical protein